MAHQYHTSIIEQNLTSALVLEDDVDWDLRIKAQMRGFGKASQLLLQAGYKDREYDGSEVPNDMPRTSPYGEVDRWDLLWLGHCGSQIPTATDDDGHPTIPQDRVIIRNDQTVPETQHIRFEFGGDSLKKEYSNHTRVISHARRNVCTLAYAVTQQGARRFLHELALSKMTSSTDLMFQQVCDGLGGRKSHTCLSVQPPLFEHHRPVSAKASFSDIVEHGNGYNKEAYTYNIRWSTKVNFPKLLAGETDYIDQYKDGQPRKDYESDCCQGEGLGIAPILRRVSFA
jgi:GR25 family glycosyltransferase involved in LPS biosynthesis